MDEAWSSSLEDQLREAGARAQDISRMSLPIL